MASCNHPSVSGYILKGKETIVQIKIHTNTNVETNPVNIPWNTDRWSTGCTHYETNKKKKFTIVHVPRTKTSQHIYSNNWTIFSHNNIHICGNLPACLYIIVTHHSTVGGIEMVKATRYITFLTLHLHRQLHLYNSPFPGGGGFTAKTVCIYNFSQACPAISL